MKFLLSKLKTTTQNRHAKIISYLSYANKSHIRILGRSVEISSIKEFHKGQSRSEHFLQVIKLFSARKKAEDKISVLGSNTPISFFSNDEGFYSKIIEKQKEVILKHKDADLVKVEFTQPGPRTKKIIVSDIDDTIVKSKAVSLKSLIFKTLFCPLSKREAFAEAPIFYKKLQDGLNNDQNNLFFYVSSSTWILYPMLKAFIKTNGFPEGPLILQDIKTEKKKESTKKHQHKFDRIEELIEFYPSYKLQLIGDAGQRDAAIYLEIAEKYHDRIDFILIRKAWWTKDNDSHARYLKKAKELGVKMIYFSDLNQTYDEISDHLS